MSIYLHEIIRVTPGREEEYMASVLSLGSLPGRKGTAGHAGQLGLFRSAEHAGRFPKVVNIWEHHGWGGLTGSLERQFQDAARDSKMEDWWRANTDLRAGGHDRVLLPTAATRDGAALARDGVRGRLFVHEIAGLPLGGTAEYLRAPRRTTAVLRRRASGGSSSVPTASPGGRGRRSLCGRSASGATSAACTRNAPPAIQRSATGSGTATGWCGLSTSWCCCRAG